MGPHFKKNLRRVFKRSYRIFRKGWRENKMIKKLTSGMLVLALMFGSFANISAEAQTASPSSAEITVSGVPTGTKSLAVAITFDAGVLSLSSASTSVSGALAVTGAEGVGIVKTDGDLPDSFTITVNLGGKAEGTSAFTVGDVLDKIGGTALAGASASSNVSSVTVSGEDNGGSSTSTSTSSGSTGGVGGALDNDTVTVTITGADVNTATALNVTLAFGDSAVAMLSSDNPTFMGAGATQLLTSSDPDSGVLTVVWDGTITDNVAVITAMLEAGSKAGTTSIGVAKVEAAGGQDITSSVVAEVSPSSVTNSSEIAGDCGTFELVAPLSVTGPGKAAVGFKVSNAGSGLSGTLNGSTVDFVASDAGVAIVTLPSSGDLDLSLSVNCVGASDEIDLGTIMVTAGDGGKAPKVKRAVAKNKNSKTVLNVKGNKLKGASFAVIPTDRTATSEKAKGKRIKATFDTSECIPDGSFVNVSNASGTDAKEIKVKGSCANSLVD